MKGNTLSSMYLKVNLVGFLSIDDMVSVEILLSPRLRGFVWSRLPCSTATRDDDNTEDEQCRKLYFQ